MAFVHAVASKAGFAMEKPRVDNDKTDLTIWSNQRHPYVDSPKVDVQVKSTVRLRRKNGFVKYALEVDAYNQLVSTRRLAPMYLILVHVPHATEHWFRQETALAAVVRHCAYWADLRGQPASSNSTKKTISIPERQVFGSDVLVDWMNSVGQP